LLEVRDLRIETGEGDSRLSLVRGVSFSISGGQTVALAGESGAGKTMTALAIVRLLPAGVRVASGSVLLDGIDLARSAEERMESVRGDRIAMVFQDPLSSLNPVYTIGRQIAEAIVAHRMGIASVAREVERLLALVEMPKESARSYPHQLSGGMRQRATIAMALAGNPDLLIADEPTTALDVTIQAQILDLLGRLREHAQMSVLLITHDLGVVASLADMVHVMRDGVLLESGTAEDVFSRPQAEYTRQLLEVVPVLEAG